MGFYTEARTKEGRLIGSKSFQVWNPNVEHFYKSLGLENPYGQYSGDKGDISFTAEQLLDAYKYIENIEFYSEPIIEKLDPFVGMITIVGGVQKLNSKAEKERTLEFLDICAAVALKEESVILNMG
ncbi:hypothetical protein ACE198_22365 [Neobacillus sp. KR4-4]|uniref:hypothetical protein n=1 Tax=Neobacillus sp. KR4-4 TaxID=3344872 RepID=UPI0035CA5CC4